MLKVSRITDAKKKSNPQLDETKGVDKGRQESEEKGPFREKHKIFSGEVCVFRLTKL
jgi:hypothetical protein